MLLALPRELRDQIWKYVLIEEYDYVNDWNKITLDQNPCPQGLLGVCHQTAYEGMEMWFWNVRCEENHYLSQRFRAWWKKCYEIAGLEEKKKSIPVVGWSGYAWDGYGGNQSDED